MCDSDRLPSSMSLNSAQAQTILVVDDMPEIRELISCCCVPRGFRVFEASNGVEAMKVLQQEKVEIMLTDIVMPEQEGLETLMSAKNAYPNLKIIVMSGHDNYLQMARRLGADQILFKPFKMDHLFSALAAVTA